MPFNPGQFVFQPRPLQQFDFGQGFRDVIQARQGKRNSDLLEEQQKNARQRFSAEYARDRGKASYDSDVDRYTKREAIAERMRAAVQGNDKATFQALKPSFLELGGKLTPQGDSFLLETGERPSLGSYDVQGAYQQIYGGGGPSPNIAQPKLGQPFQMPSPLGGGGSLFSGETNQFDPPALPGASAEAAGTAGPPPVPQAPTQPNQPVALSGPNPTTPPALSPYRLNFNESAERNRQQTRPFYDAVTKAAPVGAQGLFRNYGEGLVGTGMPLERTQALGKDTLNELAGTYRGGLQAEATRASLGLRAQGQEFMQAQRLKDKATARMDYISKTHNLPKLILASRDADVALEEIAKAEAGNPDAVNAAIVSIVKAKQDRVSDADFKNASTGARNIWDAMKRGVAETLFTSGFTTDHARDLREVVGILKASQEKAFRTAQVQMLHVLTSAKNMTPDEREAFILATAQNIPAEYWDPVVKDFMGVNDAGAPGAAADEGENLGVVPLPRPTATTPQRTVGVSPNGVPLGPGSRVPTKPPKKSKYDLPGVDKKTQRALEEADKALEGL